MIYVENKCKNPWYNLALEEYLLKNKNIDDDIIALWQNDKSVIIGRHQNTISQINQQYAKDKDILIARRMTGGGAVYHDMGNLNYTFITSVKKKEQLNFKRFAEPVTDALRAFGLKTEVSGRNDITFAGKKFSGTAQAGIGDRIMFHGTILYDVDTKTLSEVLRVNDDKIRAKGIRSVKSRVVNLKPYLPDDVGIDDLKKQILISLRENNEINDYILTNNDITAIMSLVEHKYRTDEWIFGEYGEGDINNQRRFDGGEIELTITLDRGCIDTCRINGDFLGLYSVKPVEDMLCGKIFKYDIIKKELNKLNIIEYFGSISVEQILKCMFDL